MKELLFEQLGLKIWNLLPQKNSCVSSSEEGLQKRMDNRSINWYQLYKAGNMTVDVRGVCGKEVV